MKEIAFDSLLLIAADDVSQQAINQLRSEGIYSIEDRSCTLINMVVVSTAEGAEHIHQVLENHERARKNVRISLRLKADHFSTNSKSRVVLDQPMLLMYLVYPKIHPALSFNI